MSDGDSYTKDPVPVSVGDGSRTWVIDTQAGKIGSGHFGDVYRATSRSSGKKVAVKLEHRSASIALREWEVYRCLAGDGAPKVYWTGREGSYYVIVMDLLGCTLQKLLESSPNRRLPWEVVSAVGYRGVKLLEKLHSKGYVHGDVKPENFLCEYGQDDPRRGLKMIDFGLASRWRDTSRTSGHIAYGQRVDHFSGTVRYASIHAHLGRWLSRRDDLESLGYVLLFLLLGSLPWQGYNGENKNMCVCETKGRITVGALCGGAPQVMEYWLAYVRQMKFEETPDYEYLLMLCSEGDSGIRRVRELMDERGAKRGREELEMPNGKRFKVVIPKTEKRYQWIIVSTSARSIDTTPQKQCYTTHTSYRNLVREVEKKWGSGMRVSTLSFAYGMYCAILNQKNSWANEQWLHFVQENTFPRDWVRVKWEEGAFITSVTGNEYCWGVVCSAMAKKKKYKQQSYIVSSSFPAKWISERWNKDYYVTSIAVQGRRFNQQWCVVMSRGAPYNDQAVELDFVYPSQSIHARWNDSYFISGIACTDDQSAFVLSRGEHYGEEQRCTRTSHGPLEKIREDWNDLLFVTCLDYGRVS